MAADNYLRHFKLSSTHDFINDFSTSIYSMMKYPSASNFSSLTTGLFSPLLEFAFHTSNSCDEYLDELLGFTTEKGHNATCHRLADKLKSILQENDDITSFTVCCDSEKMDLATKPLRQLFIKSDICPDVFLNCNGKTFLQFEVHSTKQHSDVYSEDDYCKTIRKLGAGLAEQLRCLRQVNPEIVELCGFYVPTGNFSDKPIEKVICIWNEDSLTFCIDCFVCNSKSVFEQHLLEVVGRQQHIFSEIQFGRTSALLLPLTQTFVGTFGNNAKQLRSGESFVIRCDDKIYKLPLFMEESRRLMTLYAQYKTMDQIELPSKFIIPKDVVKQLSNSFFVFSACTYNPITRGEARVIMDSANTRSWWLNGVVDAIQELHEHKMAHLDIRLANICYGSDGQPLLIDIDRSVDEKKGKVCFIRRLSFRYGNSDMYTIADDEPTIYKLDFKQLAIMLLDIISDRRNEEYYHTKPPPNLESAHQFLKDLYNGEFKQQLFHQFLQC